ncbi:uncharacterized protein LOC143021601 [Oratosquilla oratoria]|uniref:uncharacterized protein LOC143021601 n=1 Tax=Oratosquilla oratoria TaxID=337810 RepID=UPI003F767978
MGQDVNNTPSISSSDLTLEVIEDFTYLGSTNSSNLSDLNKRIGKAATAIARLSMRVWDNHILTLNTKMQDTCLLSTLLYGSETWTLYSRQEHRLNTLHLRNFGRILGISGKTMYQKYLFFRPGRHLSSVPALRNRRHVRRMDDVQIPKDIMYGELITGFRPAGRPVLRYKDICK